MLLYFDLYFILFFFLHWRHFSFRHKELSQGKLTFFAAGISSVLHPVRKFIVVVDERNDVCVLECDTKRLLYS